jgi:hypothetical protein
MDLFVRSGYIATHVQHYFWKFHFVQWGGLGGGGGRVGRGEGKSVGKPSQGIFQDAEFLECSGGIVNSVSDHEIEE